MYAYNDACDDDPPVCEIQAKDKDGAWRVWQRMKQTLVATDHITQRALAQVFQDNPSMAEEVRNGYMERNTIDDACPLAT